MNIRTKIEQKINKYLFNRLNPEVQLNSNIQFRLPQYIHCGRKSCIGENSKLLCWDKYNGIIFEQKPQIKIGLNTRITRNLTIQCANKVIIGDNVLIASDVFIIDYNHDMNPNSISYLDNPLKVSDGVFIEDGCWIGNNVIILGGVKIGKKSIIGAGAVVTHDIPEYSVAAGNPAKVIKKFNFASQTWDIINSK